MGEDIDESGRKTFDADGVRIGRGLGWGGSGGEIEVNVKGADDG